jgi:outer membrane protein assembly factor BamD (BamD/ComL family)
MNSVVPRRSFQPHSLCVCITIGILFLAGGAVRLQAQPWTLSYFRGLQSLKNKQWDQAINQLSNAINAHPASQSEVHLLGRQYMDYYPYLYRGIAYFQKGERQKAQADLQHEDDQGEVPRGIRDTKAAGLLNQFLPLVREQKHPGPFVEGMKLFNEKDYRGAIEKFRLVPATSPRYDEAKNFITLAQDEIRKTEEYAAAAAKAQKAKRLASEKPAAAAVDTSGRALYRDALALYNAGRLLGAKRKFQELKIKEPANPDCERYLLDIAALEEKTLMGVTAYLEGDYPLAISQLTECAKSQTDNPHLYAFLAYSCAAKYLLAGRRDTSLSRQARDAFNRLQKVTPSYAPNMRFVSPGILSFLKGE